MVILIAVAVAMAVAVHYHCLVEAEPNAVLLAVDAGQPHAKVPHSD